MDAPEVLKVNAKFEHHDLFREPDREASIWRYLDFTKLVAMLDTNCLYLARVDAFQDRFEGSFRRQRWRIAGRSSKAFPI